MLLTAPNSVQTAVINGWHEILSDADMETMWLMSHDTGTILAMVTVEFETDFLIEWEDSMTDDTYRETFASRGEVRDVNHNRNMEMLRSRLGMVA